MGFTCFYFYHLPLPPMSPSPTTNKASALYFYTVFIFNCSTLVVKDLCPSQ